MVDSGIRSRDVRPRQSTQSRPKPVPPRQRNPALTKQDILVAARAEFCEFGLDGARVDRIAERAAANKRLLYHYFGNKEAL
jgi:AcrR family transcriptional regulator